MKHLLLWGLLGLAVGFFMRSALNTITGFSQVYAAGNQL
jgi:hypothetical protein